MNQRKPAPHMEELLQREFARLPEPDPRRMAAIRQRVITAVAPPPRRTHWFWWLAAGTLVAGVATATFVAQRAERGAVPSPDTTPLATPQQTPPERTMEGPSIPAEREQPSARPDRRFGY